MPRAALRSCPCAVLSRGREVSGPTGRALANFRCMNDRKSSDVNPLGRRIRLSTREIAISVALTIAVLFADLRGFTTLSEASTPEVVVELLSNGLHHTRRIWRTCERHHQVRAIDASVGGGDWIGTGRRARRLASAKRESGT
mgnify:CR=1 FL=1